LSAYGYHSIILVYWSGFFMVI